MTLRNEIDAAKRQVKTDRLQLSIGEIANMYKSEELSIQPEFQRLFRWNKKQKSNLIESILIGIPVPPIFAYENEDGSWELIDGLQRVSTILEFIGILKNPDSNKLLSPSYLVSAKYLTELNNVVWEKNESILDVGIDEQAPLDKNLQLFIRRSRIDIEVLKQPSDPETKFDLFRRLNRGGAYANEQEIRSCLMVMTNAHFFNSIKKLSKTGNFTSICSISEDAVLQQRDIEYCVRFMVHVFKDYDNVSDVQEFLDNSIVSIAEEVKVKEAENKFKKTFDLLHNVYGDRALFPNPGSPPVRGTRFSLRSLEAVAVGIGRNIDKITSLPDPGAFVKKKIVSFWKQPEAESMSSPGMRGTQRLQRTVPFGTKWFEP